MIDNTVIVTRKQKIKQKHIRRKSGDDDKGHAAVKSVKELHVGHNTNEKGEKKSGQH